MTAAENRLRVARATAAPTPLNHRDDVCNRGHFLGYENTRIKTGGARSCKLCERASRERRGS